VPGAKVLLTTLTHRALPLIRYELTDRVTLEPDPNPAGRPYACLAAVEGRTADTLHLPDAGGGVVEVLPYRLAAPFAQLPDVRQFQIVWDGERMTVRIVPRPTAAADTSGRVRAALVAALADAGAAPIPLEIVTAVTGLERQPGPAAKLKLIVNREPHSRASAPTTRR
jgi:phenylacetate-coenzyme A ligase PaaK-like adenylate-forming protein